MRITIEPTKDTTYRTVVIEVPYDDLNIFDLWHDLIAPAILAKGYAASSLNSLVLGISEELKLDTEELP